MGERALKTRRLALLASVPATVAALRELLQ